MEKEKVKKDSKKEWIVILKAFACMAVVMIHVIEGWKIDTVLDNSNIRLFWVDCIFIKTLIRWAVPCFIMVSGCLLLDPKHDVSLNKIKSYIKRTLCVLGIFALLYCFIENVYNFGFSNIPKLIYMSVFNLFQQKSWGHMWYLYMLLGLYAITPILRKFVQYTDENTSKFIITLLFIFSNLIPTINECLGIEITTLYLSELNYVFIYLMGYYIIHTNIIKDKYIYIIGILGTIGYAVACYFNKGNQLGTFMLFEAMMVMKIFANNVLKIKSNKIIECISKYSFGIYIVHPIWLNLLNKGFKLYPDVLPIFIGEFTFFIVALSLSLVTCMILHKLPVLKKLL